MKCLGLANGRSFYGITTIKDALECTLIFWVPLFHVALFLVFDKSKVQTRANAFRADTMEEYEDEQGNIFSRKTFEDLRKQGLI